MVNLPLSIQHFCSIAFCLIDVVYTIHNTWIVQIVCVKGKSHAVKDQDLLNNTVPSAFEVFMRPLLRQDIEAVEAEVRRNDDMMPLS